MTRESEYPHVKAMGTNQEKGEKGLTWRECASGVIICMNVWRYGGMEV